MGDDLNFNPNADIWFQYVVAIMIRFPVQDLKIEPLIELFSETEKTEKQYNLLYGIFKIRSHHIAMNLVVDIAEEEKIKMMLTNFYENHDDYIQKFTDGVSYRDLLKRKLKQYDSFFKFEGNMQNAPNAAQRLIILDEEFTDDKN